MSGMQPSSSSKASSTPGWVPPRLVRPYFMDARKWIRRYAGICFTNPKTKEVQHVLALRLNVGNVYNEISRNL